MILLKRIDSNIKNIRSRLGAKWGTLILLLPPACFGIFLFGPRALIILFLSSFLCLLANISIRIFGDDNCKYVTPGPLITGLLIGLTVGVDIEIYMIVIGCFVAEYVGKYPIKTLGHNIFNPAVLGRTAIAILELITENITKSFEHFDITTKASALAKNFGGMPRPNIIIDAFLGFTKGAIGETSALILIISGFFLFRYIVVKKEAAISMLMAVPLFVLVLPPSASIIGHAPWVLNPFMYLLGGPVLLIAFFFSTDPTTTPKTRFGGIVFGVGVAGIGVLGKFYTNIPGFEMFGILIMNALTPMLNKKLSFYENKPNYQKLDPNISLSVAYGIKSFYTFKKYFRSNKSVDSLTISAPSFEEFSKKKSFSVFRTLLKENKREYIFKKIEKSSLKGCGGAAFPVINKWKAACIHNISPFLIVNGMEGEPETFKDFILINNYFNILLEGIAITALAIQAKQVFIVINSSYKSYFTAIEHVLQRFYKDFRGKLFFEIKVVYGPTPDLYILGEETALINFLESRRGEPRLKNIFPTERGLWGKPTVTHNVETLSWVPLIINSEMAAVKKLVSLSGDIQNKGVYEVSFGTPIKEIIKKGGGVIKKRALKGFSIGGMSGGLLPASYLSLPFEHVKIMETGAMLGSGAIKIFSDIEQIYNEVINAMNFFKDESCGRCTPCRLGTQELMLYVNKLINKKEEKGKDIQNIKDIMDVMSHTSTCGLGKGAPNLLRTFLRYRF